MVTLAYGMPMIDEELIIQDVLEAFGEPEGKPFENFRNDPPTNPFGKSKKKFPFSLIF